MTLMGLTLEITSLLGRILIWMMINMMIKASLNLWKEFRATFFDDEDDDEVERINPPIEEAKNKNEGDEEFYKFTMTR